MGRASDIRELREALVRFARAEGKHARLLGDQELHIVTNTSRDEVDLAHADLLRHWPVRRINAVLNAAEKALDPEAAGWLVEQGPKPVYLAESGGQFFWTSDHLGAIRFARKSDADGAVRALAPDHASATEHRWD
jgi:hypothetical protein